jgi:hypothetical protein
MIHEYKKREREREREREKQMIIFIKLGIIFLENIANTKCGESSMRAFSFNTRKVSAC